MVVPLPIPGLVSTRVMVMEFIEGVPLSQLAAEMTKRGVQAGSPESIFLGKKLLTALTDAYSAMIFGSGIIHGYVVNVTCSIIILLTNHPPSNILFFLQGPAPVRRKST